jgi:transcriptional regulator with XRE-family HTH domain
MHGEPAGGGSGRGQTDVGRCLRELRAKHGYSLRGLAEESGLAVNTLSLIENRKVSPSVSTLQQIAMALGEPITAFFESREPSLSIVVSRRDARPKAGFAHGALEELGAGFADRSLVPLLIHLDPSAGAEMTPIVHTGPEFVYCLKGKLEYWIQDQLIGLGPGDSLVFEAHLPHCWRNPDAAPAEAILILSPSEARDRAADRHLAVASLREAG